MVVGLYRLTFIVEQVSTCYHILTTQSHNSSSFPPPPHPTPVFNYYRTQNQPDNNLGFFTQVSTSTRCFLFGPDPQHKSILAFHRLTYEWVYEAAEQAADAGHQDELPLGRSEGQVTGRAGQEPGHHVGQADGHPAKHARKQACKQ